MDASLVKLISPQKNAILAVLDNPKNPPIALMQNMPHDDLGTTSTNMAMNSRAKSVMISTDDSDFVLIFIFALSFQGNDSGNERYRVLGTLEKVR